MPRPRVLPSDSTLEKWYVEEGLTQQQIADRVFERDGIVVQRSSVGVALSRAGLTNRIRYDDFIPWKVKVEHSNHHLVNILRYAAREARGEILPPRAKGELDGFRARQARDNCVIAYVPESDKGWWLVPRRKAPKDRGMIRDPDKT